MLDESAEDRDAIPPNVGVGDVSGAGDAAAGRLGLTAHEAEERLRRFGPNAVRRMPPVPLFRRVLGQLKDPLMIVLLCAIVLTVFTRDFTDAAVIALVIVVNTSVGTAQEVRAARAIAAIGSLTAPRARVIRDGLQIEIPADGVVPGDLLVVAEGDWVAADAELIEAAALAVDESSLTGESVPVDKEVGLGADGSQVNAGSVAVRGRGLARVIATGGESRIGRVARMLTDESPITPLQRRLRGLSRILALVVSLLCVLVAIAGLVRGEPLELMAVTAISLAVAAVPESLPAVVTLSLALGARRMATRHAIVRNLAAVETLGSVTVVATDKTGTLTEGNMVVQRLWTVSGEAEVTGQGYQPTGLVIRDGKPVSAATAPDLAALVRAAALCSDAVLRPPSGIDDDWSAVGDPTEAALVAAAAKFELPRSDLAEGTPRVAEFPFDSRRKRMTTVHQRDDQLLVVCKGAPELVVGAVTETDPETASSCLAAAHRFADQGLRVLAIAASERPDLPRSMEDAERRLTLLGLVAMADPVKPAAAPTLAALRTAGIRPVLITGDHPTTAASIARQVGLLDGGSAGGRGAPYDVDASQRVGGSVVARATPEQKVAIVDVEQHAGQVVAMTGDGVNDGPALRHADIGVAMGRRGTEVARQAADLVLADDELATLTAAVGEGRRVYANIRRFLLYGLSGGAAEVLVMLLGPFFGMPLPLLPAQILWINLLTHGLVGVALGAEPAESNVLRLPPRPPEESVLGAGLWARILRIAVLIASVTLAVGVWAQVSGREWQTLMFMTLGVLQLGVAIAVRAQPRSWSNPFLLSAVGCALLLQLAAVYVPILTVLLGTRPPSLGDLVIVAGMFCLGWTAVWLERRLHPR